MIAGFFVAFATVATAAACEQAPSNQRQQHWPPNRDCYHTKAKTPAWAQCCD